MLAGLPARGRYLARLTHLLERLDLPDQLLRVPAHLGGQILRVSRFCLPLFSETRGLTPLVRYRLYSIGVASFRHIRGRARFVGEISIRGVLGGDLYSASVIVCNCVSMSLVSVLRWRMCTVTPMAIAPSKARTHKAGTTQKAV